MKDQDFFIDVTRAHIFLGYKPLVIALTFTIHDAIIEQVKNQPSICLSFHENKSTPTKNWRGFPVCQTSIGRLMLNKISEKKFNDHVVLFFEGVYGEHSFLNSFHQFTNRNLEKLKKKKQGNVTLPGNLVDQVRIAYAVPRVISIITVSDGELMNMFPTDLHGPAGSKIYIGSLRIGGLANEQVERTRRIVVSQVNSSWHKQAYAIGTNHMMVLQPEKNFPVHVQKSLTFGFPLPEAVTRYKELVKIDSWDDGIHRIHCYEVVNEGVVDDRRTTLAHIHQYYAQWRLDHGLQTDFLWR